MLPGAWLAVVMHGRLQACDALPASLITAEIEHENVHQAGRSHFAVSSAICLYTQLVLILTCRGCCTLVSEMQPSDSAYTELPVHWVPELLLSLPVLNCSSVRARVSSSASPGRSCGSAWLMPGASPATQLWCRSEHAGTCRQLIARSQPKTDGRDCSPACALACTVSWLRACLTYLQAVLLDGSCSRSAANDSCNAQSQDDAAKGLHTVCLPGQPARTIMSAFRHSQPKHRAAAQLEQCLAELGIAYLIDPGMR